MVRLASLAATLLIAVAPPAARASAPSHKPVGLVQKPRAFILVQWAHVVPPAHLDPALRDLLVRIVAAIDAAHRAYGDAAIAYEKQLDADPSAPPPEPREDFSAPRTLCDEALRRFPAGAVGMDATWYLAGWIASEEQREDAAMSAFHTLATRFPKSRYAPEALYRLGDLHSDRGALDLARRAYERVIALGDTPFLALALFKAGWTAMRAGRGAAAWAHFSALVARADAHPDDDRAVMVRPEAFAYLALLLTDPDLDGDRHPDKGAGWPSIAKHLDGSQPFHAELAEQVAHDLAAVGDGALADRVKALAADLRTRPRAP